MSNGDVKICKTVRDHLNSSGVLESESEIQNATKFSVKSGVNKASILVYNTGKLHVEGADSELKTWLKELKTNIECGAGAPKIWLPAEIERFPQTLVERVPACDGVIVWYYQEALRCYKAGSTSGAAFMLGAASEKAVLILIEIYASRILPATNRDEFLKRVNNKMISNKYDEFKRSHKSSSPRPRDPLLAQDLEQILDGAFNFYRHTRNSVGHPQIIPDLDKGVVLANMGQFIVYTQRIYDLIDFYNKNTITV